MKKLYVTILLFMCVTLVLNNQTKEVFANSYKEEFQQHYIKQENKVNVCFYDNFTGTIVENKNIPHGDFVDDVFNKYSLDKYNQISKKYIDYNSQLFLVTTVEEVFYNCDVLNISLKYDASSNAQYDKEIIRYFMINNLDEYLLNSNTFIVASAGNEYANTNEQTLFSLYENYSNKGMRNRFYIVGQLFNENEKLTNKYAFGKEVDIMVANARELVMDSNYIVSGTSFSAPVITSTVSNLLLAGLSIDEAKQVLEATTSVYKDEHKEYILYNEEEIYREAINLIHEKSVFSRMDKIKRSELTVKEKAQLYNREIMKENTFFKNKKTNN